MKLKVLFGIVLSVISLTIVGCGGGGGSSTPVTSTVSGEAAKGPIIGGDIKIFAINADGSVQTSPLVTTPASVKTRAPFGNYSAVIGYAGPVKVVVSNGSYTDEATGTQVNFTGKTLSAIVANVAGSTKVAVTPHTDLAVRKAGTVLTPANIKKANLAVAQALNLHEIDIISEMPSNIPRYKFALAVVSQAAGTGANDLTNLLSTVANAIDLTSGTLQDQTVSTMMGTATASAFKNPKINPTGSIPGVDPAQVADVQLSVPTVMQQFKTQVPITATVKRIDGAPAVNNTVDFLVTNGTGTFSTASAQTDANGVATVNITSNAEETVTFTAHSHPFTAGSQVIFVNLDKPATVTLKADQLQGITKGQGPITLSATVTRFGFGLSPPLGAAAVPDGTTVTFAVTGAGATLSADTATTSGGVATVTLNSTTAGAISATATAGALPATTALAMQFIDQPVTATLKMVTSGTLPAGITNITSLIGTLTITPPGVTVKTAANTSSATGISVDPSVMTLSGVSPSKATLLPTEVTAATPATPAKVLIPLVSFNGGFGLGEFATIVTDIAKGTFPKKGDFTLSGFKAIAQDAGGAQINLPDVTVDFVLSLQ